MLQIMPQSDNKYLKKKKKVQMGWWIHLTQIFVFDLENFQYLYSFFFCSPSEEISSSDIPKKD